MSGMKRSKALRVLRERREFLYGRVDSFRRAGKDPRDHDLSEAAALTWVLNHIPPYVPPASCIAEGCSRPPHPGLKFCCGACAAAFTANIAIFEHNAKCEDRVREVAV